MNVVLHQNLLNLSEALWANCPGQHPPLRVAVVSGRVPGVAAAAALQPPPQQACCRLQLPWGRCSAAARALNLIERLSHIACRKVIVAGCG
jgi:hypothetical protein